MGDILAESKVMFVIEKNAEGMPSKVTTFNPLHKSFDEGEIVVGECNVVPADAFLVVTANRKVVVLETTQLYVDSCGMQTMVTMKHLARNTTVFPKIGVVNAESKLTWEEVESIYPYKPAHDGKYLNIKVMGHNVGAVIDNLIVR